MVFCYSFLLIHRRHYDLICSKCLSFSCFFGYQSFFFTFCYFWNDRKWRGLNVFEMFELKGSIDLINVRMMFEICKGG